MKTTNTALLFFYWLFAESTAHVARAWLFYLNFGLYLFSIPLLFKTFFSPWHRYGFGTPKQFDPVGLFTALFGNLMSRGIGVILRTFFIVIGLIFELFIVVIGLAFLIVWIVLPFASFYLFYLGMQSFFYL